MADVEIQGIDAIIERLDKMTNLNDIERVVGQACAIVEGAAKKKAPKKTGDLKRSIQSRVETTATGVVGTVFSPLEYAPYVEYGTGLFAEKEGRKDVPWAYEDEKTGELIFTSGQKPKPYLRPALNENREKVIKKIREGISNGR